MQKIGRIRKMTVEPYLEILREQLARTHNKKIRAYISAKIKMYSPQSVNHDPKKPPYPPFPPTPTPATRSPRTGRRSVAA